MANVLGQSRPARRAQFGAALVLALALVAASCSSDKKEPVAGGDKSTTTSEPEAPTKDFNQAVLDGEPQIGGSITFGVESTIASLDPAGNLAQPSDVLTALAIYDQLIAYDDKGALAPSLATEWSGSTDLKTWTIKLRDDVKFQDGTPFNAAAVKAQFARFLDPATKCTCLATVKPVTAVDAPDPTTVIFHLDTPNAFWPNTLAGTLGFIASPTATKKWGADYARHPVGTGPFSLPDYDSLVLKKNPDYWKKDDKGNQLPYLDKITIKTIGDSQVRLASLRAGDVDMVQTADTQNIVDVVQGGDKLKVQKVTGSSSTIVLFNLKKPPFDDLRMRQAFAYALDRNEINSVQYKGSRQEAYSALAEDSPYFVDAKPIKFNLQKAKDLVAELKADGKPVDFTAICIPSDESKRILGIIQGQMKKAGMKMDNEFKDQGAYVNQIFSKGGDYEAGCFRSGQLADADGLHDGLVTDGSSNVTFYSNPKVDEALNDIRATTDEKRWADDLKTVQIETAKDIPTITLLYDLFGNIYNPKISGLPVPEPWSLGAIKLTTVYLKK